jgi:hypothetical protein
MTLDDAPRPEITEAAARQILAAFLRDLQDPYACLNAIRDWVNAHFPDYELYLEDVWNDNVAGETHFEYILRSRKTYHETDRLGYDVYRNHRDAKGVWHLDDYDHSVVLISDPSPILDFINANGAPWSP